MLVITYQTPANERIIGMIVIEIAIVVIETVEVEIEGKEIEVGIVQKIEEVENVMVNETISTKIRMKTRKPTTSKAGSLTKTKTSEFQLILFHA